MEQGSPHPWRKRLGLIVGAVIGIGAIVAVFSSSGGLGDVAGALDRVSVGWTIAAVFMIALAYLINALHLRRLTWNEISLGRAVRTDLLLYGLGNVLPGSPAPGVALAGAELRRGGLPPPRVRFVLGFTVWFNIRTLLVLSAVSFLVTFLRQKPGLKEAGLWWLVAVGVLVLVAASARLAARPQTSERAGALLSRIRIGRFTLPRRVSDESAREFHMAAKRIVGSPANRAVLVMLAIASWLADAACLWFALLAAGVHLDVDVVLLAYLAGILASGLPLLPAGAGAVEATIPAVLHHFGAPLDAALAGTLVYRGISTLLTAGAGGVVFAYSARLRRRQGETATAPRSYAALEAQHPIREPEYGDEHPS